MSPLADLILAAEARNLTPSMRAGLAVLAAGPVTDQASRTAQRWHWRNPKGLTLHAKTLDSLVARRLAARVSAAGYGLTRHGERLLQTLEQEQAA